MRTVHSFILVIALNGLYFIKPLEQSWATNKNAGTSGAVFLKMGAGARPTAMGNAFVGIADDVNAVYFNPAGLARLERPELTAMHTQWIEGLNYDFGAFSYPLASGAFAISAATLKADDLERRGTNEAQDGTFDNLDSAYGFSYAKKFGDTFSAGLTGRYIKQEINSVEATAFSGDFGMMKRFSRRPLSLGLAVRHFGSKIEFQEEGDPQPLTVDGGLGYKLWNEKLLLGLNIAKPRYNDVSFGFGTEYTGRLSGERNKFSVRAGYNSSSTDAEGATGITVGAGLTFGRLNLDFGWVPMGDLGNTFRYAVHMKF